MKVAGASEITDAVDGLELGVAPIDFKASMTDRSSTPMHACHRRGHDKHVSETGASATRNCCAAVKQLAFNREGPSLLPGHVVTLSPLLHLVLDRPEVSNPTGAQLH